MRIHSVTKNFVTFYLSMLIKKENLSYVQWKWYDISKATLGRRVTSPLYKFSFGNMGW